jgi:pimeloyl-ACP methyl ester carboxylesterase
MRQRLRLGILALSFVMPVAALPAAGAQGASGALAMPPMPLAAAAQVGTKAPAAAPAERTVSVFGETIHYWDLGSGSVVALLHGLGDRKESWLRVAPELAKNHRVLAPDQIGFGKSDKPLMDYSVQTYVDFLNEYLRQLNVQRASLVGESLGGWISALYATESGSGANLVPIEKLVLVDAAGLQQHRTVPDLNPSTLGTMRHVMELVFYDTSWLDDATLRRIFTDKLSVNDGYTVHAILSNPRLDSERVDDKLGSIKAPTLVVWGQQDQLIPLEMGQRYASGITGARLVTYDKCGHVPPQEHTAEFVKAVSEFLEKQ